MSILDKFLRRSPPEEPVEADSYDAALTRGDYEAALPMLQAAIDRVNAPASRKLPAV